MFLSIREQLSSVYHNVVVVDVLDSKDTAHLALLKRPELGVTFTKIHCWTLSQYKKCVFLDADMLVCISFNFSSELNYLINILQYNLLIKTLN